jgi:hypothetical protein
MASQLIERALAEWRDGERLLRDLPPINPEHETVRLEVIRLRDTYRRLSELSPDSSDQIAECRRDIDLAHETIVGVRARLNGSLNGHDRG